MSREIVWLAAMWLGAVLTAQVVDKWEAIGFGLMILGLRLLYADWRGTGQVRQKPPKVVCSARQGR